MCIYVTVCMYIYIYTNINIRMYMTYCHIWQHENIETWPYAQILCPHPWQKKKGHVSRWNTPMAKNSTYNECFQGPRVSKDRNDSWSLATDLCAITKAAILHLGSPSNLQSEPRRLPWRPRTKQTTRLGVRRLRPQQPKLLLNLVPLLLLERYLPSLCTSRASTWTHPTR